MSKLLKVILNENKTKSRSEIEQVRLKWFLAIRWTVSRTETLVFIKMMPLDAKHIGKNKMCQKSHKSFQRTTGQTPFFFFFFFFWFRGNVNV